MRSADEERSERLRSVDLTSGLDRVALARLAAYMDPVAVRAGEVIITEGEPGDALYIVVRGTFAVLVGGDGGERVNTVGPGHYVGELALLVDEPRSATIRADTDGELLRLDRIARLKVFPIAFQLPWGISPAVIHRVGARPEMHRDDAEGEDTFVRPA